MEMLKESLSQELHILRTPAERTNLPSDQGLTSERSRSAFGYAAGVGGVAYRHVSAAFGIEPNVPPAMRAGYPNA
jgi:hypothetical protein